MGETISIGVIGDLDESSPGRQAVDNALRHAASHLSVKVNIDWLPTESLLSAKNQRRLSRFAGIWAVAGTYRSQEGAIKGIRFAREKDWPFIGT